MWSIWWRWIVVQIALIASALAAIWILLWMVARAIVFPGLNSLMLWAFVSQAILWWGVHAMLQRKADERDPLKVDHIRALVTGRIK